MRRAAGFTIIELMIVMTIIGIISAIAIPVYQGYVTRAKVAEAQRLVPPFRTAVEDRYVQTGLLPPDNASAGFGAPAEEKGRYVGSIEIRDGDIVITFADPGLLGRTVTYKPTPAGNKLAWTCSTTLPDYLRPKECG